METALKDDFQFNVLVVDDDSTILALLREIMEMVPGCNIRTASEPSEAVKIVLKEKIDIVFTDIHMPNHSGLEFLEDLVKLEQTPEVVVMTAYPTGEDAQRAMELGATSFISKPFEDIRVVELELEKAIKKIIRQRASEKEVELKKIELSKTQSAQVDNDPVMKVSIPSPQPDISFSEPRESSVQVQAKSEIEASPVKLDRKIYDLSLAEPLVEVEVERCRRNKRQFVLGFVDFQDVQTGEDKTRSRLEQRGKLEQLVRRSDVIFDAGEDRMAIMGFECNRVGADVLEQKLAASGFSYSAFSTYPTDGIKAPDLLESAKNKLNLRRKFQIVVFEPEDFFGRLVSNMLSDPKYHLTWVKNHNDFYNHILTESESVKLVVLSLSKDKEQWRLMAKMLREGLVKWPVLLFIDVALTKEVKEKLSQLGVKAIIHRGASQEEFLYLVQSFVVPKVLVERKNFRALVGLPVTYKIAEKELSSVSFTLSRDGIFIRDMNPPAAGSIVELKIFTPNRAEPLRTQAEVLYAVPYFVGVNLFHVAGFAAKFIDLPEEDRVLIDEVVSKSLTSYLL